MKWKCIVLVSVVLVGCAKDVIGPTREITPFGAAKKNRLAILTATPRLGEGKLLSLDLRDGKVMEAKHLVDGDPYLKVLPQSERLLVFNRKHGGAAALYRTDLTLAANYELLPEVAFPNFQDAIEIKRGEAYISSHETDSLYRVKVETGQVIKAISLKNDADEDGIPEATKFSAMGERIALVLQRLSRPDFTPKEKSRVVLLDSTKDEVDNQAIELNCLNASNIQPINDNKAFVGCQGSYADSKSGAIEIIDTTSRLSEETEWKQEKMGGKPSSLFALSRFFLSAIFYTSEGKTRLSFSDGRTFTPWGEDQAFENGYWSMLLDAERRIAWVGQAGKSKNLVFAISLDTKEVVRRIELENIPLQIEWID